MGDKTKAIEELKRQMQHAKAKLGPERIAELQRMLQGSRTVREDDLIPYDRDTAMKALEIFIENHGDPEWLRAEILKRVNSKDSE